MLAICPASQAAGILAQRDETPGPGSKARASRVAEPDGSAVFNLDAFLFYHQLSAAFKAAFRPRRERAPAPNTALHPRVLPADGDPLTSV